MYETLFLFIYTQNSYFFQPNPNEKVNHHFVAFVEKGGYLYELDGRKDFPVNHGSTSSDKFLEVSCIVLELKKRKY